MYKRVKTYILIITLISANFAHAEHNIGVIVTLSGDFAKYGQRTQRSVTSVKAKNIKYIFEDEGCNPKQAINAYKKLTTVDGVKVFLGPWCGSPQTAIAPMLVKTKQLAILGSAAPRSVYKSSTGRMFSTQHSIEQESLFNAQQANAMSLQSAVIIFYESDFGRAHEAAFRSGFQGNVIETFAYTSADAGILKAIALRVKKLNPDMIYIPDAFPLMLGIMKELYYNQLVNKKIFSVYSAQSDDVLKAVGKYGEGLLFSYPQIGNKNALDYFPALAAKVINKIVEACGSKDTDCALKYLKQNYKFDEHGVLEGALGLKTVKNGSYQWIDSSQLN